MNCASVKEELPLLVGDDLPEERAAKLREHLGRCPDCTRELELLKRTQSAVAEIADADQPTPLPSDFAWQVQRRIVTDRAHARVPFRNRTTWRLPKLAPVGAAVALLVVFLLALTQNFWAPDREEATLIQISESKQLSLVNLSEFMEKFGGSVTGPIPVGTWNPSGQAGVYALLHKPEPGDLPETYSLDYCGESARLLSFRGSAWIRQQQERLIARAGTPDNIYIIIIVLPESSRAERRRIEEALLEKYQPYFNRRNGV